MANDRSPARRSWRPAERTSPGRGSGDRNWRRAESSPSRVTAVRSRVPKIFLGLLIASTCYAFGVWAMFWFRPLRPAGVYIVQAGYLDNLAIPPNAPGLNSAAAMALLPRARWGPGRFWVNTDGFGRVADPVDLIDGAPWNEGLDEMLDEESTVIVYMTGQAGGDDIGAFLYKDTKDPRGILGKEEKEFRNSAKLYIKDVVSILATSAKNSKRFLLVLDAVESPDNVAMGMLRNDFAERLNDLELRQSISNAGNITVLAPGAGFGWANAAGLSRESGFGRLVAEGLRGAAANPGERIDVGRLVDYISAKDREVILLPDDRASRRLALALAVEVAPKEQPSGSLSPAIPPEWKDVWADRWARHARLAKTGPEGYAPHSWRLYRDTLLRLDTLARSLAAASTESSIWRKLVKDLDSLEGELKALREVKLPESRAFELAVPIVEGSTPTRDLRGDFDKLWNPGGDFSVSPRERTAFYDILLGKLESHPESKDFARALDTLARLGSPNQFRPAEAHLLAILLQERWAKVPPLGLFESPKGLDLVADALKVRRQAGRVALGLSDRGDLPGYLYNERIVPFVAPIVAEGDRERRFAEDRLFAVDAQSWKEAEVSLSRARAKYEEAGKIAERVHAAFVVRDRAFADLPYDSDWVARRPEAGVKFKNKARRSSLELVKLVEKAWEDLHGLAAISDPSHKIEEVEGLATSVERARVACKEEIEDEARACCDPGSAPAGDEAILPLLGTPFIDVDVRMALVKRLTNPAAGPRSPSVDSAVVAARAGRLALAALGKEWIEDRDFARLAAWPAGGHDPSESPDGFPKLREKLLAFEPGNAPSKANAEDLVSIGDRIGRAWRLLVPAIGTLVRDGLNEPLIGAAPAAVRDRLGKADRLGRPLLGAQKLAHDEPTKLLRLRLLQRVLLSEAGRAIEDHWFSEGDDPREDAAPPYYRASAEAYLSDLAKLLPIPESELARTRAELAKPGRLIVKGPRNPLVIADEPSVEPVFRIEAPPDIRGSEGNAVVGLVTVGDPSIQVAGPEPHALLIEKIDEAGVGGRPGRIGPDRGWSVGKLDYPRAGQTPADAGPIPIPKSGPRIGELRLTGLYRGQRIRLDTAVQVHPDPEILVTSGPPPPTGTVKVKAAEGLAKRFGKSEGGALAIVLDCSKSMGPPKGVPDGGPSRYREATAAIRQILRKVTTGTIVSLWVFGEAIGAEKTVKPPELTIRRVVTKYPWRSDDDALLEEVMRRLEPPAIEPWNESPIVETMIRAIDDLRGARGFKAMVVLTDGDDNHYDRNPTSPGPHKPEIGKALLAAFAGSQIEVNIVGFKADAAEEVRREFRAIELMKPPGHFFDSQHADHLSNALASAFKPTLRYSIQDLGNIPRTGPVDLRDTQSDAPDFRGLWPGSYKLVVDAGGRFERDLTIQRGDTLIVQLSDGAPGIAIDRANWTDDGSLTRRSAEVLGWRFSALMGHLGSDGKLTLQSTLERLPHSEETAMRMFRPREVWQEVQPNGVISPPFQQRWKRIDSLPAPAWRVSVPSWPAGPDSQRPAQPVISTYWDPDGPAEPIASLNLADFGSIEGVHDRTLATPRGPVVIESIELEPQGAQFGDRRRLVVRASYPANRRFWVRPSGLAPEWSQHRFYTKAGKYTGVFWDLTEEQVRNSLARLDLISVDDFCDRARRRGYAIEGLKTEIPSAVADATTPETDPDLGPFDAPLP